MIGGGDTGSDCIGTSFRQGARSVTQLEIMPAPPEKENKPLMWPHWPLKMRTSSSQAEGAARDFAVATERFEGKAGKVKKLVCSRLDGNMKKVEGSEFELPADLVLLAMGFVSPVHEGWSPTSASSSMRAAMCRPPPRTTRRRSQKCSPPATCGAGKAS